MSATRVLNQPTRQGLIPRFIAAFEGPELLVNSARFRRVHNRVSKDAIRAVLMIHWRDKIPGHFKRGNRQKYDHRERSARYRALKRRRYGSITDLVKTGRTRDQMTSRIPRIRVGGAAANAEGSGTLTGSMELRFPFSVNLTQGSSASVTPQQMAIEIAAWTDQEVNDARAEFERLYAADLRLALANSPRIRRRLTRG